LLVAGAAGCAGLLGVDGVEYGSPSPEASPDGALFPDRDELEGQADSGGTPDGGDCRTIAVRTDGGCARGGPCVSQVLVDRSDAGARRFPFAFALDESYLYYAIEDAYDGASGVIQRIPKSGGPEETLTGTLPRVTSIAVDSTSLFWVDGDPAQEVVRRIPKGIACDSGKCSDPEVIDPHRMGPGLVRLVVAGPGNLFVLEGGTGSYFRIYNDPVRGWFAGTPFPSTAYSYLELSMGFVYWVGAYRSVIERVGIDDSDGATHAVFASVPSADGGDPGASLVTVDCTDVYANGSLGLWRFSKADASMPQQIAAGTGGFQIANDDEFVYFAVPNAQGIDRVRKDSVGGVQRIAPANAWNVVVDDDAIYFDDHPAGRIFRMMK
jgi:hypothetical protein